MDRPDTDAALERLQRLKGYLEADPQNLQLLSDAVALALDVGLDDDALALIEQYAAIEPLTSALSNLKGLAMMRVGRHADAAAIFATLHQAHGDDLSLSFNLAFASYMAGNYREAADLVSDEVAAQHPTAAAMKVEALHHLGLVDEALDYGQSVSISSPPNPALMSALAVAAIDAGKIDLARQYAEQGGASHQALSTLGSLALADSRIDDAAKLFEQSLQANRGSARGLIGQGLVHMIQGDPAGATASLRQGAEMFGSHLGSWIALGWAQFSAGDRDASRETFQKVLALDDTFAESHGALAVLDAVDGQWASAARRAEVATRLDLNCLSAALAKSMILEARSDTRGAQKIRDRALQTAVGPSGQTVQDAIVALNAGAGPRR